MSTHTSVLRRWLAILSTLFIILALTMIYLLWRDKQSIAPPLINNANASTIRIERNGFDEISLTKSDASWSITMPCKIPANAQRLEPLLGALTPGAHHYNASEVDLNAAGLVSPHAIVTIDEIKHSIGNTDLNGNRRYVQRGNQVAFVPEWVLSLINGGMSALAELTIFPGLIEELTLTNEQGTETVVTSPEDLQAWQNLSAQQIITWPPKDIAVPQPTLHLQAVMANGIDLLYSVYHTERFTALTVNDMHCAYIVPLDTVPD